MFAIVRNGQVIKTIQAHTAFEIDGTQYSEAWTASLPQDARAELGITDVVEEPHPDERFYWVLASSVALVDGVPTLSYTVTPKALEDVTNQDGSVTKGLKSQWVAQTKAAAGAALAATDWMVIRKAERNVAIPAEVAAERAQIVADCAAKEAAIQAATTVQELKAVVAPVGESLTVIEMETDEITIDAGSAAGTITASASPSI